jgi:hypothetical protein
MSNKRLNKNETIEPIIICPNCNIPILIEKLNCGIFRHGILKSNGRQIDPHVSKDLCNFYSQNKLVYGCCKPFRITQCIDGYIVEICNYI